jgi:membrane associated rhomboid family serine protease
MFPIGDTPNPPNFTPWVNWGLIAANVLVFVVVSLPMGSQYNAYVMVHGFKPGAAEVSDLLYSMFLHAGFGHLAGNMLFLWIYGDNVEHRLGRLNYLLIYLGCGVAATLTFAAFAGGSTIPLVGASGAISGVLGLYFLLFPRNKVKVFVFFFPFVVDVFLIPARIVLGVYVVVDNFLPVLFSSGSNVAYGAHLGGFFAGVLVAWIGERRDWTLWSPTAAASVTAPRLRPVRDLTEADLARRHLATGLSLLGRDQSPRAWQHFARVLELDADSETRARARASLAAIDAHPKLYH